MGTDDCIKLKVVGWKDGGSTLLCLAPCHNEQEEAGSEPRRSFTIFSCPHMLERCFSQGWTPRHIGHFPVPVARERHGFA